MRATLYETDIAIPNFSLFSSLVNSIPLTHIHTDTLYFYCTAITTLSRSQCTLEYLNFTLPVAVAVRLFFFFCTKTYYYSPQLLTGGGRGLPTCGFFIHYLVLYA